MFPKKIYLREDKDGKQTFFVAERQVKDLAFHNSVTTVAEYELKKTKRIKLAVVEAK